MNGVARPVTGHAVAPQRVRHQVRDGLAVMVFSAASSAGLAGVLLLLAGIGK